MHRESINRNIDSSIHELRDKTLNAERRERRILGERTQAERLKKAGEFRKPDRVLLPDGTIGIVMSVDKAGRVKVQPERGIPIECSALALTHV